MRRAAFAIATAFALLAAPAIAQAPSPSRAAWQSARSLADQKRYNESLVVIRRALIEAPQDTDLLWLEAAVLGWSGEHADAARRYEHVMRLFPFPPTDLRRDLANERFAIEDWAGAVHEYDFVLRAQPADLDSRRARAEALLKTQQNARALGDYEILRREQPNDLDVALTHARLLGWNGRNARAVAAYEFILKRHPANREAQLGRAQNENWRGNHRRAASLYEDMRAHGNQDPEVLKGLAFAYYWDGRPERSRDALDDYLAKEPLDREGLELARMLALDESPSLTAGVARSDDSDALRIRTTWMEYRQPVGRRTTLAAHWRRDNVMDPIGTRDPLRIGGGIEQRWSERLDTRVDLAYVKPSADDQAIGVGEAGLTWRPRDRWRVDLGYGKDLILTRIALALGINVRTVTVGADYQLTDRISLSAAERFRRYNDDNSAVLSTARARFQAHADLRTRLALTFGVERLATDRDLDHGYYDPQEYLEWAPGLDFEWTPRPRWSMEFLGVLGHQHEKDGDTQTFHNVTARAEIPLGNAFGFSLEGGHSNSNLSSESGFRQNRWAAALTTSF